MAKYMIDVFEGEPPSSKRWYVYADTLMVAKCFNDDCSSLMLLVYDSPTVEANYVDENYIVEIRCWKCGSKVEVKIPVSFIESVLHRRAKELAQRLGSEPIDYRKMVCEAWKDVCVQLVGKG